MCSYPVPKILLPHDVEAQLQKRSSKDRSQLGLSKVESQERDLNRDGGITRVENSSAEDTA